MKTLVIHDREQVSNEIVDLLKAEGVLETQIQVVFDAHNGKELLRSTVFDLLIIDLTLPYFEFDKAPNFTAAENLLSELFNMGTLYVPGDIIGVTKDLEALKLIETSLMHHMMVAIEEDADGNWRSQLLNKIKYVKRAAKTRYLSENINYLYDALILTALDEEMAPFHDYYDHWDITHFDGAKEFSFTDKDGQVRKGVSFAIGKSGQPSAASWAQSLITFFRPKVAIMPGICGGLKDRVDFGDVIFFEASYAWDYGKWLEEEYKTLLFPRKRSVFKSRPDPLGIEGTKAHSLIRKFLSSTFQKDPKFLELIEQKSVGRLKSVKMDMKPAASGSAVVANDDIIKKIHGLNESIRAVDMESYGFYHAALKTQAAKPDFFCVKSVSDFCNGEKGDDYHKVCSEIAAFIVINILEKQWEFS